MTSGLVSTGAGAGRVVGVGAGRAGGGAGLGALAVARASCGVHTMVCPGLSSMSCSTAL
jgi:hypothetical protein